MTVTNTLWSLAITGWWDARLNKLNLSLSITWYAYDKSGGQYASDWIWPGLLGLGST